MELIGSYHSQGYTVEIYFPENHHPDRWTIWMLRDGDVVGEFVERLIVIRACAKCSIAWQESQ